MKTPKLNIHGVVLLNKPSGVSSNRVLQQVKHLYNAKKAGHTGSLDPLATGLLPICLGQATKVSEYSLGADKKYTTVIKLGEVTDTYDSEGEIVESHPVDVSDGDIQALLNQFRGDIQQVPPMYSALKKDGQPLYKLARQGEVIERPPRSMTVYSLSAKRIDKLHVRLKVHCSSGFYIRSLAFDIGQALGCGAHVVELHRTESKGVSLANAVSLEQLEDPEFRQSALLPIDVLLQGMPKLSISDAQATSLLHGKVTPAEGLVTDQLNRFYRADGSLFAVGQVTPDGSLKTSKMFIQDD